MIPRVLLLLAALAFCAPVVRAQGPGPRGETLVLPDTASTRTLALELAQVSARLEALRGLADQPYYDTNPEESSDQFRTAFLRACGQVAVLRPQARETMESLGARAATLLRYFEQDYAGGSRAAVGNTMRHLGEATAALTAEAALAAGAAEGRADSSAPRDDWIPPGFEDPTFRATLRGRSVRAVLGELPVLRGALGRAVTRDEVFTACIRISEVGRELSSRADSLSPSSRRPFRNTALRADVIGESIYLYSIRNDAERRERQERLLREVEGELAAFLDVNGL